MGIKIYPIALGFDHTYMVQDEGTIMVDGGAPKQAKAFLPLIRIPPTEVDVVLGDEEVSLAKYGITGKVVHTPGHSSGSVSVLLETGDAFVGDMAMNKFPLRLSPGLPIFAEDWEQLMESWELLLASGAKTIYPSHGEPFSADIIREALS